MRGRRHGEASAFTSITLLICKFFPSSGTAGPKICHLRMAYLTNSPLPLGILLRFGNFVTRFPLSKLFSTRRSAESRSKDLFCPGFLSPTQGCKL